MFKLSFTSIQSFITHYIQMSWSYIICLFQPITLNYNYSWYVIIVVAVRKIDGDIFSIYTTVKKKSVVYDLFFFVVVMIHNTSNFFMVIKLILAPGMPSNQCYNQVLLVLQNGLIQDQAYITTPWLQQSIIIKTINDIPLANHSFSFYRFID